MLTKAALLIIGVNASGYNYSISTKNDYGNQQDALWNGASYEPGDITRFDNHLAEIYGHDDQRYGKTGYKNPYSRSDGIHDWDDKGDGVACHACGGHGCG